MTDRPIIFSGPMVRALLDGRKTQTRRLVSPRPSLARPDRFQMVGKESRTGRAMWEAWAGNEPCNAFPAGKGCCTPLFYTAAVGDRLYVREHWSVPAAYDDLAPSDLGGEETVIYAADHRRGAGGGGRHRQGMHMPRWASRLTLAVEAVRLERLQTITWDDARAEGLTGLSKDGKLVKYGIPDRDGLPGADDDGWHWQDWSVDPTAAYARLWSTLHAVEGERWQDDPAVVVLTFRVEHGNIDQVPA